MTDYQPTVSVITPVLNSDQYLIECAQSVANQVYQNWEHILIDDGSTDSSIDIATELQKRDSARVRTLHHPGRQHQGKSDSRNLGISHARGDYLCFLDSDDVFLANKLSHQFELLQKHDQAELLIGDTLYWYSWNTEDATPDELHPIGYSAGQLYEPGELLPVLAGMAGSPPCLCSLLVSRASVIEVGGFASEIRDLYEDQVLIARLLGNCITFLDTSVMEKYRQRADSDWHRSMANGKDQSARILFFEWLLRFSVANPSVDKSVEHHLLRSIAQLTHELRGTSSFTEKLRSRVKRLMQLSRSKMQ